MISADRKFGSGHKNSEDFQTCGRTIKTGLIAVGGPCTFTLAIASFVSALFWQHLYVVCTLSSHLHADIVALSFSHLLTHASVSWLVSITYVFMTSLFFVRSCAHDHAML